MDDSSRFDSLLEDLVERGYQVHRAEDHAVVRDPETAESFDMWPVGGWVQIGHVLLEAEELSASQSASLLHRFALRFQNRALGCRFALDDPGSLAIVSDFRLAEDSLDRLIACLDQITFVGDVALDAFLRVLRNARCLSDAEVDEIFDRCWNAIEETED